MPPMAKPDPDEILARMRADRESDWPDRLLARMTRTSYQLQLTEPEAAALTCASRGLSADEAAIILGKEPATVKDQLASSRRKLRAKNTCHAACEAIRQGLIH